MNERIILAFGLIILGIVALNVNQPQIAGVCAGAAAGVLTAKKEP